MNSQEIERYRSSATFIYKFENVTKQFEAGLSYIESSTFYVRGLPWTIKIQQSKDADTKELDGLGCYLSCNYGEDYSCEAQATFMLLRPPLEPFTKLGSVNKHRQGTGAWGQRNMIKWPTLTDPDENYLISDTLTVQINLKAEIPTGINYKTPKDLIKENLQPITNSNLQTKYASFLKSEEDADVTFIVKTGQEISEAVKVKAHKLILKISSPVFESMFSADMKENNSNEVEIDMSESSLRILLNHIYTGNIDFPDGITADIDVCKEVINAAEMYNFPELKEYAGMALTEFIAPENALELYSFVKLHTADAAEKAIGSYIERNLKDVLATL